jgi:predicted Zn-dependent peptidase
MKTRPPLLGFAERRCGPGVFARTGPALEPQIQPGKARTRPAAGSHRHRPPQRRRRAIAERESAKLVYGANSPYTRQPELATIGAVTVDDLKAWHDRTIGGKLIVGISGDFDPRPWKPSCARPLKVAASQAGAARPRRLRRSHAWRLLHRQGRREPVQRGDRGPGHDRHNPDVPTLAVMNEILGGGFASRLFQKVRTELGLAYEVEGGISFDYDHPGPFSTIVVTKSASTVEATKAALAEIAGADHQALHRRRTEPGQGQSPELVPFPLRHQG